MCSSLSSWKIVIGVNTFETEENWCSLAISYERKVHKNCLFHEHFVLNGFKICCANEQHCGWLQSIAIFCTHRQTHDLYWMDRSCFSCSSCQPFQFVCRISIVIIKYVAGRSLYLAHFMLLACNTASNDCRQPKKKIFFPPFIYFLFFISSPFQPLCSVATLKWHLDTWNHNSQAFCCLHRKWAQTPSNGDVALLRCFVIQLPIEPIQIFVKICRKLQKYKKNCCIYNIKKYFPNWNHKV